MYLGEKNIFLFYFAPLDVGCLFDLTQPPLVDGL